MYTQVIGKSLSNVSIVRWKIAGADATPKGSLVYLYKPLCMLMVVSSCAPSSNNN